MALSYWPIRKWSIMSGLFAKGRLNHGGEGVVGGGLWWFKGGDQRAVSHGTVHGEPSRNDADPKLL